MLFLLLTFAAVPMHAQFTAQASGNSRGPAQTQTTPQQSTPSSASASAPVDLSGRVVNGRTHQPISRALVQLGGRRVLTDHDGIFHFPEVNGSTASFRVSKPGFFLDSEDQPRLYTLPSDSSIELTLYPEAIVFGTIIDVTGEPLAHLSITARSSTYDETGHHWSVVGHTQTLSDGSFRLSLSAGTYALQVTSPGRPIAGADMLQPLFVPANPTSLTEALHLAPGDQVRLDLRPTLRRTYDVALQIDRGSDRGFPMLTARPASGPAISLAAMPNRDEPGSFHVALPNGTYEILADMQTQEGRQQGRTAVTVAGRNVTGVKLTMAPTPLFPVVIEVDSSATSENTTPVPTAQQLGLTLTSSANPANLYDQILAVSSRGNSPPGFSLPEGTYSFLARTGGAWYVTAASCGGTDLLQQNLNIAPAAAGADLRVRVSNRTADLTGTVQLNGAPASAWIYLIATTPSASPILTFRSAAGVFSRPYLAPGTYRAVAFEHRLSADLQNPEVLNRYLSRVQNLNVNPGDHANLNLNVVPAAELIP